MLLYSIKNKFKFLMVDEKQSIGTCDNETDSTDPVAEGKYTKLKRHKFESTSLAPGKSTDIQATDTVVLIIQ